jgi:hypothetical protein
VVSRADATGSLACQANAGCSGKKSLEATEDFDELLILSESDIAGRKRGIVVPEVEEALAVLWELSVDSND